MTCLNSQNKLLKPEYLKEGTKIPVGSSFHDTIYPKGVNMNGLETFC